MGAGNTKTEIIRPDPPSITSLLYMTPYIQVSLIMYGIPNR